MMLCYGLSAMVFLCGLSANPNRGQQGKKKNFMPAIPHITNIDPFNDNVSMLETAVCMCVCVCVFNWIHTGKCKQHTMIMYTHKHTHAVYFNFHLKAIQTVKLAILDSVSPHAIYRIIGLHA